MSKLGIYRSQTQQMPGTVQPYTAVPIIRRMSTATRLIADSGKVINISGYSTVRGVALQGRTPTPGAAIRASDYNASATAVPVSFSKSMRRFGPTAGPSHPLANKVVKLQSGSGGR